MIALGIDPGPEWSAYCGLSSLGRPIVGSFGICPNAELLRLLQDWPFGAPVVIEKVASYGMPVGAEVFETVFWSGRFAQVRDGNVERLTRKAIVTHLCGSARAKDSNVRQALIDRFGGLAAIGRKANPGPLYGISGDVWSALAVAVTWADLR